MPIPRKNKVKFAFRPFRALTFFPLIFGSLSGCANMQMPSDLQSLLRPITDTLTAQSEAAGPEADSAGADIQAAPPTGQSGLTHAPSDATAPVETAVHEPESSRAVSPEPDASSAKNEPAATAVNEAEPPSETPAVPSDVWQRIRAGYSLPVLTDKRIAGQVAWYKRHQAYLDRVADRAEPYLWHIAEQVEARGMPAEIALLPIVESAFQPFAYSHGRAAGIWQFIPGTGRLYGLRQDWWYDGRRDVHASTRAALDYLGKLAKDFDGDWLLALAAYNSGEGTVGKAIKRNRKRGKPTDFWSLDLPRETKGYVPRLLAIARIIKDPAAHGLTLKAIPNQPYFAKVDIDGQIDLALAADLAGIDMDELYRLNPGFNRWATSPNGPHHLLLPVERAGAFQAKLAELPDEKRLHWVRHRIKSGETLIHIAKRYHTPVKLIKQVNRLRGHNIRAGKSLVIPVATRSLPSYTLSAEQRRGKKLASRPKGRHKLMHVVRNGDTLWDISRKYNVGVRQLAKWNAMAPRDVLKNKQKLVIWVKKPVVAAQAVQALNSAPTRNDAVQRIKYVVRRGDSLARIAAKFKVSIRDLLRWNALRKDKYLQPGQALKLFVDVTRQAGA